MRVLIHLFLLFAHDHSTKYMALFHLFLLWCTTIRPKVRVHASVFFHLYTTIRPKIRVLINLIFFLVHNHLTKVRGHSYFLIYYFLNCANIPFAIFKAVLSLYYISLYSVRSMHGGCSKHYCCYISYAMLMSI